MPLPSWLLPPFSMSPPGGALQRELLPGVLFPPPYSRLPRAFFLACCGRICSRFFPNNDTGKILLLPPFCCYIPASTHSTVTTTSLSFSSDSRSLITPPRKIETISRRTSRVRTGLPRHPSNQK